MPNIKIIVSDPHFRGEDYYELSFDDHDEIYDVCFYRGNYDGGSLVTGKGTTAKKAMVEALEKLSEYQKKIKGERNCLISSVIGLQD